MPAQLCFKSAEDCKRPRRHGPSLNMLALQSGHDPTMAMAASTSPPTLVPLVCIDSELDHNPHLRESGAWYPGHSVHVPAHISSRASQVAALQTRVNNIGESTPHSELGVRTKSVTLGMCTGPRATLHQAYRLKEFIVIGTAAGRARMDCCGQARDGAHRRRMAVAYTLGPAAVVANVPHGDAACSAAVPWCTHMAVPSASADSCDFLPQLYKTSRQTNDHKATPALSWPNILLKARLLHSCIG